MKTTATFVDSRVNRFYFVSSSYLAACVTFTLASVFLGSSAFGTMYTTSGGQIPDNAPAGPLVFLFAVTDVGNVSSVDITFDGFTHTWAGDLTATLSGPGGSPSVTFLNRSTDSFSCLSINGDSSNFGGSYRFIDSGANLATGLGAGSSTFVLPPGDYAPSSRTVGATCTASVSLTTAFAGTPALGEWSIRVSDSAQDDTGAIQSATLNINVVPEPSFAAIAAVFAVIAVRRK